MTDFFKQLDGLISGVDLSIAIRKKGETLTVSIIPKSDIKDKAKNLITPLVITGTASEIDECFFSKITEPLEKTAGVISNIGDFEKNLEKVTSESKMAQATKDKEKKDKEQKKTKYDKLVKKAEELIKAKDIKKAIGAYNEAKKFTDKPAALDSIINKLVGEISQAGLFGQTESADDLRNTQTNFEKEIEEEPSASTDDDNLDDDERGGDE